ncbi:biliverdin-producing heme oxygenase [Sphingomicrobium flavum]|uniref:biliverdin-producing heme oxygenase n=1 Tax=Sphingomicrobium flavum TaxID=1229164 RepID=UPI0021ADB433|nr:biliverdin-producing heme oxygenase [Sphingomicrobium flavum]
MSARFFLKEQTAEAHERLDAHFGNYDLSNPGEYAAFLTAHAAALLTVEQALDDADAASLVPEWPQMRRSPYIRADLEKLGADVPPLPAFPALRGDADILGALYVLEGSRLGGKLLRQSVGERLPAAYLQHLAPTPWPEFVALIERKLYSPVEREQAAVAANRVFAAFLDAAMVA